MAESRSRQRLSSQADEGQRQPVDLTKNLPAPVVLALLEWLAIPDLLAVGTVDCSFRDLTKEEVLWKSAARHLWKSALMDGQQSLSVGETGIHETARAAKVTLQDICRSMVGAWPSSIEDDFHTRPGENLQAVQVVDGVLQPYSGTSLEKVEKPPMFGGGGGGSSSSSSRNGDVLLLSREKPGLCSGVVYRGHLGGDRAVRANVPFPFMATMETHRDGARFKPSENDLTRGCVVLSAHTVFDPTVRMYYPDEFLARVKADAPFSMLWPGHAAAEGKDASGTPEEGVGGSGSGGGVCDGAGAAGLAGAAASLDSRYDKLRLELEKMPSTGPAPFFHAGHTAYFEITLENTDVPPLDGQQDDGKFHLECVAIGLANDRFKLKGKQPGWSRNSYGFHSDDGWFYHGGYTSNSSAPFKFGPGDTVGCGLLYPRGLAHYNRRLAFVPPTALAASKDYRGGVGGAIFFTKNGRFLGIAFRGVSVKRPLYPVIGLDSHCLVTANFGAKPFAFDVPAFESWFTGTKLNSYAPSAPESVDERAIIETVYSGRNGFTNPRLLRPYILLMGTKEDKEEAPRPKRNALSGATLGSETRSCVYY